MKSSSVSIYVLSVLSVLCSADTTARKSDAPKAARLPKLKHAIAVIAHRGGSALAPENTLAAFRNAIALGADYVEVDVRTTKDGVLVLMHDRSVNRTTNGKGNVRDLTLEQIRSLDASGRFSDTYPGEKVPTFDECLKLCRGKINVYVDHKDADTTQVFAAIRSAKMERSVVIYNGVEELRKWKNVAPHLPIMPSVPNEFRRPGGMSDFHTQLAAEVLDGSLSEWTADLVQDAQRAGAKVYVDGLGMSDNDAAHRKALQWGVDGIQTDHPDRLIAILKTWKPERKH